MSITFKHSSWQCGTKCKQKKLKLEWQQKTEFREGHLEGQIVVLLLLIWPQSIPPLPQDLADCPVVLVRVSLVHQGTVTFAEDHECIHWTADVVLLSLVVVWKRTGREWYLIIAFYYTDRLSWWTDLPISIFRQRAKGLCSPLHRARGGWRITGHTWWEPVKKTCAFTWDGKWRQIPVRDFKKSNNLIALC